MLMRRRKNRAEPEKKTKTGTTERLASIGFFVCVAFCAFDRVSVKATKQLAMPIECYVGIVITFDSPIDSLALWNIVASLIRGCVRVRVM